MASDCDARRLTASSNELLIHFPPYLSGQVEHLRFNVLALNGLKAVPLFGESHLGACTAFEAEAEMSISSLRSSFAVGEVEGGVDFALGIATVETARLVNHRANSHVK